MHLLVFGFRVSAPATGGGCNNKLVWLTEAVTQQWPTYNEAEMPEYPWHNAQEEIQRLRKKEI